MPKSQPGLIFLISIRENIDSLTDNEAGQIFKAAFAYQCDGALPGFTDRGMVFLWRDIRSVLDHNRENYRTRCEAASAAGKISAEKRKQAKEAQRTLTNVNERSQASTDLTKYKNKLNVDVDVNVNESESYTESENEANAKENSKKRIKETDSNQVSDKISEYLKDGKFREVKDYFTEKMEPIRNFGDVAVLHDLFVRNGAEQLKLMIDTASQHGARHVNYLITMDLNSGK